MSSHRIGLVGTGALAAVAAGLLRDPAAGIRSPNEEPGRTVDLWVADRGGNAIYGLDLDLILAQRVRLDRPTAVAARPDGGAWVLGAADESPVGPSDLFRIDAKGAVRSRTRLRACRAVRALGDGSAIVLEEASEPEGLDRVLRIRDDGELAVVHCGRALTCIAAGARSIGTGDEAGVVRRWSLDSASPRIASVDLNAPIAAIEFAGIGPGWVLTRSEPRRIHALDADLRLLRTAEVESTPTSLAADPDSGGVWCLDGPRSTLGRLGGGGLRGGAILDLPVPGGCRAVPARTGGVTVVAPGCILGVDRAGKLRSGQGGFAHLVDGDRVPSTGS